MKNIKTGVKRILSLFVLCLLMVAHAAAQTIVSGTELTARVDEYVNALVSQNRFSGAILVARDGQVLLSKGYGMANLEDDVPNTPQTKFRLGSITKQFTATAIMMLQEQGKLNVQDAVCKFVENCPAAWSSITVHNLLTHTSGIPNFTGFPDYMKTMTIGSPISATIARFKDKPLDFKPGERFSYSNSGYVLLGHIIEKASGKTYDAFLRESIFEPLKMTNTGYEINGEILKHRAAGYVSRGNKLANAAYLDMTIPHAAGALYSTVEDLYVWDQALHSGKLVKQKSLDAMLTPVHDNYAYGLGVDKQFKMKRVAHGGGINGFNTFMMRFPTERLTIIVLSNIENATGAGQIAAKAARVALSDKIVLPVAAKVDAAILKNYVGRYAFDMAVGNFVFDVTLENGELFVKPSHQDKHKFTPVSETEFYDSDDGGEARFIFQKDEKGNVTGLLVRGMTSRELTARRLELPPPSTTGNTTFKLKGYGEAKIVAVAGTFNSWNQSQTLCAREADEWICRVDLTPGKHTYKFVIDGNWITDPANPVTEDDGHGNINSVMVKK